MALDRERLRRVAEDLDLAGRARLDPEGRALGARVAQQRPEHEPGAHVAWLPSTPVSSDGVQIVIAAGSTRILNALTLIAVAAVELVQHLAVELDRDLRRRRRLHERRALRLPGGRAGERAHPVDDARRR